MELADRPGGGSQAGLNGKLNVDKISAGMTLLYFEAGIMDCLHICVSKITEFSGSSDTMSTLRAILVVSAMFIIYLVTFIFQAPLPAANRSCISASGERQANTLMGGRLKHRRVKIL